MLTLQREVSSVVLVPLEGIDLQLGEAARRARQQPAPLQHLLQEKRVGMVEHGQVHFALGEQVLQFLSDRDLVAQSRPLVLEQHGDVQIAAGVDGTVHGGAELQDKGNPVAAAQVLDRARYSRIIKHERSIASSRAVIGHFAAVVVE